MIANMVEKVELQEDTTTAALPTLPYSDNYNNTNPNNPVHGGSSNNNNHVRNTLHQIPSHDNNNDDDDESAQIEMRPLNMDKDDVGNGDQILKEQLLLEQGADGIFVEQKPWNLQDWLYPPHLPRSCQLLRRENIAIPMCYLLVGILQGLSGPLINVYPLDLGATEAQQTTLSSIKSLPASFKLLFGFMSDNFPILGFRRKSYMIVGWGLAALSMTSVILTTDLTLDKEEYAKGDGTTAIRTVAPENAPSIPFLSLAMLLFGTGESLVVARNACIYIHPFCACDGM
jgi:hypothetical protein